MSRPAAGTTQKRLFSQRDYLAPLPIPTGEQPADVLNTIWRKNEVFLDIGSYSIGAGVMVLWPLVMMFLGFAYGFRDIAPEVSSIALWGGSHHYGHSCTDHDPRPVPPSPLAVALQSPTP